MKIKKLEIMRLKKKYKKIQEDKNRLEEIKRKEELVLSW